MITIVPRPGESLADVLRLLLDLADGDRTAVRTGGGGAVVTEELAFDYLLAVRAGAAELAGRVAGIRMMRPDYPAALPAPDAYFTDVTHEPGPPVEEPVEAPEPGQPPTPGTQAPSAAEEPEEPAAAPTPPPPGKAARPARRTAAKAKRE